jgi:hypothetical protein
MIIIFISIGSNANINILNQLVPNPRQEYTILFVVESDVLNISSAITSFWRFLSSLVRLLPYAAV